MKYSALLGTPLAHSVSPVLFSCLAKLSGAEYAHIKIQTNTVDDLTRNLKHLSDLGFVGCNITLPYKTAVLPMMDVLDASAAKIGAVNTVLFDRGRFVGFNTDAEGAAKAIGTFLKPVRSDSRVIVIGAGGAARAIVYELDRADAQVGILNRTLGRAEELAKQYASGKVRAFHLTEENLVQQFRDAEYIINATSVGMFPDHTARLIPTRVFQATRMTEKMCFDAVLNPYMTTFLLDAAARGAAVCSGLSMMVYQAIAALRIWTGVDLGGVDVNLLCEALKHHCAVVSAHEGR